MTTEPADGQKYYYGNLSNKKLVLLAPMASMLEEHKGRFTISSLAMRSLLDSLNLRLDETREISRYLIGLLVFLGLLGTFWGLLNSIDSVGTVINSLGVADEDSISMFLKLNHIQVLLPYDLIHHLP